MTRWMRGFALFGLAAVATVGCDDDVTVPADLDLEALREEVAVVSADGVLQDLSLIQDPGLSQMGFGGAGMMGGGPGGGGPGGGGPPCQGMAGGAFQCQPLLRDGFTIDRVVTFYDEAGGVMDSFERGTTDKVVLVVDASGSVERERWSATIVRHRDMTLTGLTSELHTTNGTATEEVHRSRNPEIGASLTYDMTGSKTIADVVHAVPRSEHPYPLSGTITRQVHVVVTRDGVTVGERDVTVVITFDGTRYATLTVDGESFQVDLDARPVNPRGGVLTG